MSTTDPVLVFPTAERVEEFRILSILTAWKEQGYRDRSNNEPDNYGLGLKAWLKREGWNQRDLLFKIAELEAKLSVERGTSEALSKKLRGVPEPAYVQVDKMWYRNVMYFFRRVARNNMRTRTTKAYLSDQAAAVQYVKRMEETMKGWDGTWTK